MTQTRVNHAVVEPVTSVVNGGAMAAILASGVGAFAVGLFVILHETGLFVSPSLYAPAGGLSGRTTFAVLTWVIAWGVLHARWRQRSVPPEPVCGVTLVLIGLGVLGTFPPVWQLF